jgi:hypothetical protein
MSLTGRLVAMQAAVVLRAQEQALLAIDHGNSEQIKNATMALNAVADKYATLAGFVRLEELEKLTPLSPASTESNARAAALTQHVRGRPVSSTAPSTCPDSAL